MNASTSTTVSAASGAAKVEASSSDDASVRCLAYRAAGATLLWIANLTATTQRVQVRGDRSKGSGKPYGIVLDDASFERATTAPAAFAGDVRPLALDRLALGPYAVVLACIPDR